LRSLQRAGTTNAYAKGFVGRTKVVSAASYPPLRQAQGRLLQKAQRTRALCVDGARGHHQNARVHPARMQPSAYALDNRSAQDPSPGGTPETGVERRLSERCQRPDKPGRQEFHACRKSSPSESRLQPPRHLHRLARKTDERPVTAICKDVDFERSRNLSAKASYRPTESVNAMLIAKSRRANQVYGFPSKCSRQ
jgi:hypothetical protein